ncbi:MAG: metallophosphoesterase family protein [Sphaerochaetaceae bacterium]|jgi:putative phosphoesterase
MNRIVVCSDVHGDASHLALLLDLLVTEKAQALLCTGDLGLERLGLLKEELFCLPIPLYLVRGNCDQSWQFSHASVALPPRVLSFSFQGRSIVATHGDYIRSWVESPIKLQNNDIFVSGHTHRCELKKVPKGPYVLNPGSLSQPRDHRKPSYAVITEKNLVIKELKSGALIAKLPLEPTS